MVGLGEDCLTVGGLLLGDLDSSAAANAFSSLKTWEKLVLELVRGLKEHSDPYFSMSTIRGSLSLLFFESSLLPIIAF